MVNILNTKNIFVYKNFTILLKPKLSDSLIDFDSHSLISKTHQFFHNHPLGDSMKIGKIKHLN